MSISARQFKSECCRGSNFYHKLIKEGPLSEDVLQWMSSNGKNYKRKTLERFNIHGGVMARYQINGSYCPAGGSRGFVCHLKTIIIPVGPIQRCYAYELEKKERWRVIPAGYGAQWLGDLSHRELIHCEGEWDFLRLQDLGFQNVITHTAGAGTFLKQWIPLFQGKKVWIVYDMDAIGQKGAARTANLLHQVAEVFLVRLPLRGTPEENDVSDFFRIGGTAEDLQKLLNSARKYERPIFFTRRDRACLRARRVAV